MDNGRQLVASKSFAPMLSPNDASIWCYPNIPEHFLDICITKAILYFFAQHGVGCNNQEVALEGDRRALCVLFSHIPT